MRSPFSMPVRPDPVLVKGGLAGLAAALIAGCGGGGSGDNSAAPPQGSGGYLIGGAVSGLEVGKALTLQNNGGDDLAVGANGSFAFASRVDPGAAYAVTVRSQPAGQRCAVSQGAGSATAHVSGVAVRCETLAPATYTVGGTVAGLAAGQAVVLQNNGGDDLSVGTNGGFVFPTAVAAGASYAVTLKSQPPGLACSVRNASGTVSGANAQTIEVSCSAVIALLEGTWVEQLCLPMGMGNARVIARQGDLQASVKATGARYADGWCSPPVTVMRFPTDLGNFVFHKTESSGDLTAYWGVLNRTDGPSSRNVWARMGPYLCMHNDYEETTRTRFATLANVEEASRASLASKWCYTLHG